MDYLLNSNCFFQFSLQSLSVLNLIINGLPSKQLVKYTTYAVSAVAVVLNLIINGLPSKLNHDFSDEYEKAIVLNLIINGLPSKLYNKLIAWASDKPF